jgi:hypothetical protein
MFSSLYWQELSLLDRGEFFLIHSVQDHSSAAQPLTNQRIEKLPKEIPEKRKELKQKIVAGVEKET